LGGLFALLKYYQYLVSSQIMLAFETQGVIRLQNDTKILDVTQLDDVTGFMSVL